MIPSPTLRFLSLSQGKDGYWSLIMWRRKCFITTVLEICCNFKIVASYRGANYLGKKKKKKWKAEQPGDASLPSGRRALHRDVFCRQSEARCAPCGTQVEHTNLLVPVLSEAPARLPWRGLDPSLVTAQTRGPVPSYPQLICGKYALWGWSGVWSVLKTGADGQKCCKLSQKKRFGDLFCGVKGLRRFIHFLKWS